MDMEYIKIQMRFNEIIKYSQDFPKYPKTTLLFKKWYESKKRFIDAWGGLIYEVPETISIPLTDQVKKDKLYSFMEKLRIEHSLYDLCSFIYSNMDSFYENKVINNCSLKDIKVGMKLLKSFKYFISDSKLLQKIQDEASMLIQENTIKGKLCFSVHPLDYISSSENAHNWRSCHALDGEFRAGNLSYMVDKVTIISYLKSEKGDVFKLPHFPENQLWNSKKWRMLLFLSESYDIIFAGKQYPFSSDSILPIVKKYLFKSLSRDPYIWNDFHNDYITSFERANGEKVPLSKKYFPIQGKLYSISAVVKDHADNMAYNDLLESSTYIFPFYITREYGSYVKNPKLIIGDTVPCLYCGEDKLIVTDSFMCKEHELKYGISEDDMFFTCDNCGERHLRETGDFVDGIGFICQDCFYELEVVECNCCGNYVLKEAAREFKDNYYCDYCYRYDVEDSPEYISWKSATFPGLKDYTLVYDEREEL